MRNKENQLTAHKWSTKLPHDADRRATSYYLILL